MTGEDVQGPRPSLTRRAAVRLLGENGARTAARSKSHAAAAATNKLTADGRSNRAYLAKFENIHAGGRCVILGNGPSLNDTDLSLLRHEITFGLNRIYLMYKKLGFSATYHVAVNRYVVEQCADELTDLDTPLFTTARNRHLLAAKSNVGYLNDLVGPLFSTNIAHGIWQGATVTNVAMQLAYYMGFEEVILVGVDHNFASKGAAHKLVQSQGADPNHFDPNYFGKGFKWQLPDLETSEVAYRLARTTFESTGRRIVDATVGGKLEVFPKVELESVLR